MAPGTDPREIAELKALARERHVPFEVVEKKTINSVVRGNHQGVAVQIDSIAPMEFKAFLESLEIGPGTFVCLLDDIQDPQNLGAIIRNAVCFGCAGIILPKRRSAGISPGVMKASSGALAHCPVAQIANLGVAVERLKEKGFSIVGTDAVGAGFKTAPTVEPLPQAHFDFPLGLMLGNESQGIKPTLKKSCDKLIHIPQESPIASLNVSSASAILFYAITRPR